MEVDGQRQPQLKDSSTSQISINPKLEKQYQSVANLPNNGDDDHRLSDHEENPNPDPNPKLNEDIIKDKSNNDQDLVDQEFFDQLPPGYRFTPTDAELILHYLKPKIQNKELPRNQIRHVNLYQFSPDEITGRYNELTESMWYFFTPRDRKYPNGNRPNRAAGTGYWKATGADKPIIHDSNEIGYRKALVFYEGKPPKGEKTSWIMHEYRVKQKEGGLKKKRSEIDMRLDDYILCRIYKKSDKNMKILPPGDEDQNQDLQEEEVLTSPQKEQIKNGGSNCSIGYRSEFMNGNGGSNCTIGYRNEFMNPYVDGFEYPNGFHSQPMNKRMRPIDFPPMTNFAPFIYSGDNMSVYLNDENTMNLQENHCVTKAQVFQEFGFSDMKNEFASPGLDNLLISMYPHIDESSLNRLSAAKRN